MLRKYSCVTLGIMAGIIFIDAPASTLCDAFADGLQTPLDGSTDGLDLKKSASTFGTDGWTA